MNLGWTGCAVATLALGLVFAPPASDAQQPKTMPRIGVLGKVLDDLDGFRQGLGELGYVEGRNVAIDYRPELGSAGRFEAIADEFVRHMVAVIFAPGPAALKAAAKATRQIPIVASDLETDPIAGGFAASLSRPGGNVTGFFLDAPELMGKWLELLKEMLPGLSHVTVLWDPATGRYQLTAANAAARVLGVQLQTLEVRGANDLDRTFASAIRWRPDALIQLSSPVMYNGAKQIADLAQRNRLPAVSMFKVFPEAGGLLSYGADPADMNRRSGAYVGKILKGAKAGDLPIVLPTRFELVLNLKTAKALGLTIPQSLLYRADAIIK